MDPISVVVPVLDEAPRLRRLLATLAAVPEVGECVVADGGSRDRSAAVATAAGARVLRCERPGRSRQLNAGAAAARGAVLWFLHADTLPSPGMARHLLAALRDPAVVGGAFRRRFVPGSCLLACTARLGDVRSRWWGLSFGDQAQFVRREAFDRVGGFADCQRGEDLDLARRLRRLGRTAVLGPPVRTSSRRFAARPLATAVSDAWWTWRLWRDCRCGSSP